MNNHNNSMNPLLSPSSLSYSVPAYDIQRHTHTHNQNTTHTFPSFGPFLFIASSSSFFLPLPLLPCDRKKPSQVSSASFASLVAGLIYIPSWLISYLLDCLVGLAHLLLFGKIMVLLGSLLVPGWFDD